MKPQLIKFITVSLIIVACQKTAVEIPVLQHSISSESKPWIHERFDDALDQFTFAIITDLNGGERPGIFEVAINQLNLLRPEFILSVGDLIDGGTEDRDQLTREWDSFDNRAAKAVAPFFHLGGNHDLTNVTMRDVWTECYGPRYYHFIYKGVLFLMMDSEDYNETRMQEIYEARAKALEILAGPEPEKYPDSEYFNMPERLTGEISNEQSDYFEKVIAENQDVRWTFVLMHKPVWKREVKGGLERVESALVNRQYTLINGHFHSYSYDQENGKDYIMLGTTGGGQFAEDENSFDHVTLITMTQQGPAIANLRLDGILDKQGQIPGATEDMCFQASKCDNE